MPNIQLIASWQTLNMCIDVYIKYMLDISTHKHDIS